jgi:DNA-binding NtrC family response regulator
MKKKVKLLVVDDEDIVRESLCDWLSSIGYKVLTANCGEEALRIIRQKKVKIMTVDEAGKSHSPYFINGHYYGPRHHPNGNSSHKRRSL